jgi:hypothetical protein
VAFSILSVVSISELLYEVPAVIKLRSLALFPMVTEVWIFEV